MTLTFLSFLWRATSTGGGIGVDPKPIYLWILNVTLKETEQSSPWTALVDQQI